VCECVSVCVQVGWGVFVMPARAVMLGEVLDILQRGKGCDARKPDAEIGVRRAWERGEACQGDVHNRTLACRLFYEAPGQPCSASSRTPPPCCCCCSEMREDSKKCGSPPCAGMTVVASGDILRYGMVRSWAART
jgi:hypothetical protein